MPTSVLERAEHISARKKIDSLHVTKQRSTDQSRNGCRMCHFRHAQLFEITHAENIKSPLMQHSCRNAKVVEAFCHAGGRLSTRCRPQRRHAICIEPAAPPGAHPPRFRALALLGRRPHQCVESHVIRRPRNLHISGPEQSQQSNPLFDRLVGDRIKRE